MYARVLLPTGSKQLATLVSKDALVLGGPQPMVFVVDGAAETAKQGKVAPRAGASRRRRRRIDSSHRPA